MPPSMQKPRTALHHPSLARPARRWPLALALAAVASAVLAASSSAAVTLPHSIAVFYHRDFVTLTGFKVGDVITTDVLRNGVVIGSVTSTAVDDPATAPGGSLIINHPGGVCWTDHTPDLQPGDVVRTTVGATVDSTAVADVDVTQKAFLDANGDIVAKGFAATAAGGPIPLGEIGQRLVANKLAFAASGGKRTLRAPGEGTLAYDPVGPSNPAGTNWTATYTGLSDADKTLALGSESRLLWNGTAPTLFNLAGFPAEMTFAEVGGPTPATPGPSIGCPPLARDAVTSADAGHTVNGAAAVNLANSAGDLVVSGVAQDTSSVTATLTDGAKTITAPAVVPAPAAGAQTWSATFPAAQVATLADGRLSAAATYTLTAGGTITATTLPVMKDLVAPPAPSIAPGAGTYTTPQSVSLNDGDPTAVLHWTNDGSAPSAGALFAAPISVTASQTLKAVAIDAAGNPGPVASAAYVIQAPPAPAAPPVSSPPAPAPAATRAPDSASTSPAAVEDRPRAGALATLAASTDPASMRVGGVVLDPAISVSRLRRGGLRFSVLVPASVNVLRVRVYRVVHGVRSRTAVYTTYLVPVGATRSTMRLRDAVLRALPRGLYELALTPGASRTQLGSTTRLRFRVVR